ncbi:hypothetical protein CC80DRAFT_495619 [Byssothecium circinans]|uniref:Gfd2/YDR514C-like C-terminal domain-containing protein n=1 Tax=Byssothecium circinans TaxID=147558 RepID=A0A6A5TJU2_9PLEO|nr:hypothetical protein CC80DRAFT_495619 [Byssothecium circinans]
MASSSARAARLARLSKLVQSDLSGLPDRPPTPPLDSETVSDDDTPGGISLAPSSKQITPVPTPETVVEKGPASAPGSGKHTDKGSFGQNTENRAVWQPGATSSYNVGSMPKHSVVPIRSVKLPPTNLKQTELATEPSFAPIVALSKYPYKFCDQAYIQDIASAFFDVGKFWAREWDLYYVWDIDETKPLILVSEKQFQDLIGEINSALNLRLEISSRQRNDGLVGRFPDHPRCQPRFLGRSHSKDEYDSLTDNVPSVMVRPATEPAAALLDDDRLQIFKQMTEDMWDLTRAKNKATREKRKLERLTKQKEYANEFKRAQRYLGLRPTAPNGPPGHTPALTATNVSLPAPFPFDKSVVFVCVDVESYERAHNKITEIGIATLDTRDLVGVAPGRDGEDWRPKIKARHFRIQDHAHLVNSEFVSGCPERFDFGESEWVKLVDAPTLVADCFKPPFCGTAIAGSEYEQRNLIFLGHDTQGDIRYLQNLGFDATALPNMLESLDTASLYRVWRREQQTAKLGNILYDFDIAGFNLHNAGNDAVFTVQAMLAVCVREASIRGTSELKATREEDKAAKAAAALVEAKQRAEDDAEGWSDNEANGDGGAPVKIVMKETLKPPMTALASTNGGGRGRGRGRGDYANMNVGYRAQNTYTNGYEAGGYRQPSRPQANGYSSQSSYRGDGRGRGRSQGQGRGRGRGCGTNANTTSDDGSLAAGPQVKYYW